MYRHKYSKNVDYTNIKGLTHPLTSITMNYIVAKLMPSPLSDARNLFTSL